MAFRLSTALRDWMLQHGSMADAFAGGELRIYSGSQPATADAAPTGTLLARITDSNQTRTAEVLASGSIELTGGSAGSVDTLTVDGVGIIDAAVPYNTSLAQTALDLAAAINRSQSSPEYRASVAGSTVSIIALQGSGAGPNGFTVAGTTTTLTATYTDMANGVNSANGLKFGTVSTGVLGRHPSQSWTGAALANGTAGWFRFVGPVADNDGADATATYIRCDGLIATSGAEMNLPSTTVAQNAIQTVTDFQFSLAAS